MIFMLVISLASIKKHVLINQRAKESIKLLVGRANDPCCSLMHRVALQKIITFVNPALHYF